LKAVDQAVAFSMNANVNEKQFQTLFESIYKFYNNEQSK
jgi:hypothetical protein